MTQRSQPPADRPGARRDSTRPPRARRSADRAPYPGAATPTWSSGTASRLRHAATTTGTRATTSTAPTPATVWSCGPDPIDPAAEWPVPIVETVVAGFAHAEARVLLLPWPTSATGPATPTDPSRPGQPPADGELATAREAVRGLGRPCEIIHLAASDGATSAGSSRPFWADLVTDQPHPAPGRSPQPSIAPTLPVEAIDTRLDAVAGTADLIITALPPHLDRDGSLDRVALAAARLLALGGILAVYTHSDWYHGSLLDPTGPMVAAAQNADLLYLQHIVTLHTPIRDGHLHPGNTPAAEDYARARHRAAVRDLPAPHARAHGDLLLFAQPHDHHGMPSVPPGRPVR